MKTLVLAFLLLVQQDSVVRINVQTKDGNTISGTTDVTSFVLESSLGKATVQLKDVSTLWFSGTGDKVTVGTADGTNLTGKISQTTWKVSTKLGEFTLKNSDIGMITVAGVVRTSAAPPSQLPPAAPKTPGVPMPQPPPAAPKQPPAAGLTPAKTLSLGVVVSQSLRMPDGKKLLLLDASDSKVILADLEKMEREKEIALSGGETLMSLAPGGNVLVAAGKRTVTVVSLSQGKVTKTFPIEVDVSDVCAVDDQTVVASTSGNFMTISIPKQSVVSRVPSGRGGRLYLSRDGRRIYTAGGLIHLPDKAAGREEIQVSYNYRSSYGSGEFAMRMSPDGRFSVMPFGAVYRLGKSHVADLVEVAKVEPHGSAAWAPAGKRLYLVTDGGFVKEYDSETLELKKTWALGYRLQEAYADEAGTCLFGVGQPVPPGSSDNYRYPSRAPSPGDLYKFDIPK